MHRSDDGSTVFRARCSCGWRSQPMPAELIVEVWERHHRRVREAPVAAPRLEPLAADAPGFAMRYADGEEGPVLEVAGELDLANVRQLEAAVADVLGPDELHLDLRLVTFVDSTALNALVGIKTTATTAGMRLRISPSSIVQRIIEVTGLTNALLH
jgi:anti-anti-sigma factor